MENINTMKQMKLLLLGDQAVGKSSLMFRFTDDIFNLNMMGTAGIDLKKKNVTIHNEEIKVMIYDTAGHQRFRTIAKSQYQGSQGIILIYDVTDRHSLDGVTNWMNSIKENVSSDVEILLVGNKIDLQDGRVITSDEGKKLAEGYNVSYIETSAKSAENVNTAFMKIIENIYMKTKAKAENKKEVINTKKEKKKNSKCC